MIIAFSLDITAKESPLPVIQHFDWVIQNDLVIQKTNGRRSYVVQKDQTIKIWTSKQSKKGKFLELRGDTLLFNSEGRIIKFDVANISKIKLYGKGVKRIVGGGVKIWGGVIIAAGFGPLLSWGAPGLLISVPAWVAGYGIYKVGGFISQNRTFKLNRRWKILQQ